MGVHSRARDVAHACGAVRGAYVKDIWMRWAISQPLLTDSSSSESSFLALRAPHTMPSRETRERAERTGALPGCTAHAFGPTIAQRHEVRAARFTLTPLALLMRHSSHLRKRAMKYDRLRRPSARVCVASVHCTPTAASGRIEIALSAPRDGQPRQPSEALSGRATPFHFVVSYLKMKGLPSLAVGVAGPRPV